MGQSVEFSSKLDQEVKVHPGGIVAAIMSDRADWGDMWFHLAEAHELTPDRLQQVGTAVLATYPEVATRS